MAEPLKFQIGDVELLTIKCIAAATIGKTFFESTERINRFCRLVKNGVSLMIECL